MIVRSDRPSSIVRPEPDAAKKKSATSAAAAARPSPARSSGVGLLAPCASIGAPLARAYRGTRDPLDPARQCPANGVRCRRTFRRAPPFSGRFYAWRDQRIWRRLAALRRKLRRTCEHGKGVLLADAIEGRNGFQHGVSRLPAAASAAAVPHASFAGLWSPKRLRFGRVFRRREGQHSDSAGTTGNYQIATMERDGSLVEATCVSYRDVNRGLIVDGTARLSGGGSLSVVGQGSLMVGLTPGCNRVFARRITHAPACGRARLGAGPTVAVIGRYPSQLADYDPRIAKGYRYETFMLPMLTTSDLQSARVAVLAMSCAGDKDAADWQQRALLDFVAGGRVLLVRDADLCSKSAYAFIPYPFTTAASGAGAARGSVLYVADSSALASNDRTDAQHYVDTAAYLKNYLQQLGDADVMQTNDAHWCGLMFAKNATGSSGWVRAYARYGKGLIIYDGFDADDRRAGIPQALALNRLAYNVSPGQTCHASRASRRPCAVVVGARDARFREVARPDDDV